MTSCDESQSDDECSDLDLSRSLCVIGKKVINRGRWTKQEVIFAQIFFLKVSESLVYVLLNLYVEVDCYLPFDKEVYSVSNGLIIIKCCFCCQCTLSLYLPV